MTAIKIYYIASKEKAVVTLRDHWLRQGIELIKYDLSEVLPISYLMILEPLQIGNQQYAISKIWKRWLFNKSASTRLFVAGFVKSKHPNFLNLLELPDSLRDWLEELYPVGAFPLQYAGTETLPSNHKLDKYTDPWDRFLPSRGIDMVKQLARFLDGHDEHYSINNQLSRIRKELVDIKSSMESSLALLDEEQLRTKKKNVQNEWAYLQSRWLFYRPLFDWLPFYEAAGVIRENLKAEGMLSIFFKNIITCRISLDQLSQICEAIDHLIEEVKQSIDRHVYPENYW
ncbi:MAG: hypothetical protein R2828_09440 [Saprospiraceae bacterium]